MHANPKHRSRSPLSFVLLGLRGEWQGTIAIVDKATSSKFAALVGSAEQFLALLPWPREFEKDVFSRPDFTSVEVVAFGCTHVWAGQNLPNYREVRQGYGFKNLSYANVVRQSLKGKSGEPLPFLVPQVRAAVRLGGSRRKRMDVLALGVRVLFSRRHDVCVGVYALLQASACVVPRLSLLGGPCPLLAAIPAQADDRQPSALAGVPLNFRRRLQMCSSFSFLVSLAS